MSQQANITITLSADQAIQKSEQLKNSLEGVGQKSDQAARKTEGFSKMTIATLTGTATAATSLYFAFDNLDKIQLRVARAARSVEEAQQKVNRLQQEGKQGTQDYADAIRDLNLAQEKHKIAANDSQQAILSLGLQTSTFALTVVPNLIRSLSGVVAGHGVAAGAAIIHAGAETAASRSIWQLTWSMLSNPLFAIPTAAAIAAAIALVATNTWGLRDAIFGTTEAVKENSSVISESGISSLNGYTSSIQQNSKAIKENLDLVRMWRDINEKALNESGMIQKKNDPDVNFNVANQYRTNRFWELLVKKSVQDELWKQESKGSIPAIFQNMASQFGVNQSLPLYYQFAYIIGPIIQNQMKQQRLIQQLAGVTQGFAGANPIIKYMYGIGGGINPALKQYFYSTMNNFGGGISGIDPNFTKGGGEFQTGPGTPISILVQNKMSDAKINGVIRKAKQSGFKSLTIEEYLLYMGWISGLPSRQYINRVKLEIETYKSAGLNIFDFADVATAQAALFAAQSAIKIPEKPRKPKSFFINRDRYSKALGMSKKEIRKILESEGGRGYLEALLERAGYYAELENMSSGVA